MFFSMQGHLIRVYTKIEKPTPRTASESDSHACSALPFRGQEALQQASRHPRARENPTLTYQKDREPRAWSTTTLSEGGAP